MAESISTKQFTERTAKAVEALLKSHHLPPKPQGGIVKNLELMGFILREEDLEGKSMKEVRTITEQAVHELGGKPAIYVEGGRIILGFVGKPKNALFL